MSSREVYSAQGYKNCHTVTQITSAQVMAEGTVKVISSYTPQWCVAPTVWGRAISWLLSQVL